jgi:2-phospho-L-lactate guanylyltransferase
MSWTAVVPFKGRDQRKTRLRSRLSAEQCQLLTDNLFEHLVAVLSEVPGLSDIALLSDVRPIGWKGQFISDEGRGLNGELSALVISLRPTRLVVVHADLPLVSADDIAVLVAEDSYPCAIAPDRNGTGTNALALTRPRGFHFAFGQGSFAKHLDAAKGGARIVSRLGLGLDIDTEEDLNGAIALGFHPPYR